MMEARSHARARAATSTSSMARAGVLQRKCACGGSPGFAGQCEHCQQEELSFQRSTENSESGNRNLDFGTRNTGSVPPIVDEVLRSSGEPLDARTRASMEPRFGHDFSRVRVHTDSLSQRSARAVDAAAFTVGQEIVFAEGQYAPGNLAGRWLIAHELAHVAQQSRGNFGKADQIRINSDSGTETEARYLANQSLLPAAAGAMNPTINGPVTLERIHPALAVAGVLAAMGGCSYAFYRYALSNYSGRQGYNDKFMHCWTSCKIASWCGGGPVGPSLVVGMALSEAAGILKEVADYIKNELHIGTPADASWDDWIADQYGLLCALNLFGSCAGCCRDAPGAVSPVASAEAGGTESNETGTETAMA
jgi:Domain of unknown function (DUF4157)